MTKYKAFISFRRSHSTNAELVKNTLIEQYGFSSSEIFLDKHNIGPEEFDKKLETAVKSSSCLILIVTKECFIPKQDDWYLKEIKTAITNNITIIPVLFDEIKSLSTDLTTLQALNELEGEYFTAEEIAYLKKTQSIRYDYDLSEATFSKLNKFVEEADKKSDNSTVLSKVKRGARITAFLLLLFAIAFVFFFGLGVLWGYFTSSSKQDKIIKDHTLIENGVATFNFGGIEARYDIGADSIYLDNNTPSTEKFSETIYDQLAKSCTVSGAIALFDKNISYLKYFRFLQGGPKQNKLALLGMSVAIGAGSICGFSQGCEFGRNSKQKDNASKLYPNLQYRTTWNCVFKDNINTIYLNIIHEQNVMKSIPNVLIWMRPDSTITIAKEHGLQKSSVLLKYNQWEIGKHSYRRLTQVINQSNDTEKEVVFMEENSSKNIIKAIKLPKGRDGIVFDNPIKSSNDSFNYVIQEYNNWKNNVPSGSQI